MNRNRNLIAIRKSTRGVTLVEVLVTLGIVSILGAIIVPAFGLTNLRAKASGDMSNLRQLGLATQVYVIDADGLLPTPTDSKRKHEICAEGSTWRQRLLPYLNTRTLFVSPTKGGEGKLCPAGSPIRYLGRYGAQAFWASNGIPGGEPALSLSSIQIPSDTFLLGINGDSDPLVTPEKGRCGLKRPFGAGYVRQQIAGSTWNFADGHAAFVPEKELYDGNCGLWKLVKPREYFH